MKAILTIFPRPAERDGQSRLGVVGPKSPEQTQALMPVGGTPANAPTPSIESVILEKLLAELDARGGARMPAPYMIEQPPARNAGLLRILWGMVWAMSLVICVFVVKYLDRNSGPMTDPAQVRSISNLTATITDQNRQFSKMIDSIEALAGVVASASQHTAAIPAMLKRLTSDLKQASSLPVVSSASEPAPRSLAAAASTIISPPFEGSSSTISMGGHHHPPIDDVVATANVVVHHNAQGVMDYWLVPRIMAGARIMRKVIPITQTNLGTFVHDVEEIKDYIVTPSGEWLPASGNESR